MALTILEGSTFCICDDLGDIEPEHGGFFSADTRHLSHYRLTVNRESPLLLSCGRVEYFSAAFYLRNPVAGGLSQDAVSIARRRFVGESMQDAIVLTNETSEPVSLELAVEVGSDFADIFAVKDRDFALGDPVHAPPLPPPVAPRTSGRRLLFEDVDDPSTRTHVVLSREGETDGGTVRYQVALEPRERWELTVDVLPSTTEAVPARREFGEELDHIRESLDVWRMTVPRLHATWDALEDAFGRSVSDLAALRMRGGSRGLVRLPAAGMPWFMTVFGRDTIITSLQTLLFGPQLARGALEVLAELQATADDPSVDAEPGKIVHEVRRGKAARRWFPAYYGTVDATPLYLVLLSELWRWAGDDELVRTLEQPALRALAWIDEWGDADGDGFVEFRRRSERGLVVQSWKDSADSQRFADGTIASGPIAPVEVQGYVYDAKTRLAELAREVWGRRELAERLEREAAELRRRFDRAFWVDGRYALALDGEKRPVDSLCSNIGHLLWSGIVPDERVDGLVSLLFSEPLWSGWGVRTMSTADRGYNPLSYHNGTVWPHDNSLIALGLARYGRHDDARRIVRALLEASTHFDHELPEVFAGLPRSETPFPIAYPTAARPQAWAAGTPVALLQVLLGLRPDRARDALVSGAGPLPKWAGAIELRGVPALGRAWDVAADEREIAIIPA